MYNTEKLEARIAKLWEVKELLLNTESRQGINARSVAICLNSVLLVLDEVENLMKKNAEQIEFLLQKTEKK